MMCRHIETSNITYITHVVLAKNWNERSLTNIFCLLLMLSNIEATSKLSEMSTLLAFFKLVIFVLKCLSNSIILYCCEMLLWMCCSLLLELPGMKKIMPHAQN